MSEEKIEHLRVRLLDRLPQRIERVADDKYRSAFLIPKARRLEVLKFIENRPQHIVKRSKTFIEVLGYLPDISAGRNARGGADADLPSANSRPNAHRTFISLLRNALQYMPAHDLAKLNLIDLKKHPRVKELYELFKGRPQLLNEESVLSAVKSKLLNYAEDTGQVRESVADVRMRRQLPAVSTTAPSLQTKKEGEFDRLLLLVFGRFLVGQNIPDSFLKSAYFTPRAQLQQIFTEDQQGFRARIEEPQADQDMRRAIVGDYRVLVNTVNQQYLSRYPFEVVANTVIDFGHHQYRLAGRKLQELRQHALAVPGSQQKFPDLGGLFDTYVKTLESKLINYDHHFMPGLRGKMTSDADFISALLTHGSRITGKALAILNGQALSP